MSIPQEMMMQAEAIGAGMDSAQEEGMQIATPQGQYGINALNALVDTVNQVLPMLGQQEPYPSFTEDQTMFPMEFVNVLMAIMTIAEDAGIPVEMELSEVVSDRDVAKLSALLQRLITDENFQAFLMPEEIEEEVMVEEPMSEGEPSMSDEELFASRI
jgi:hypothetical protein